MRPTAFGIGLAVTAMIGYAALSREPGQFENDIRGTQQFREMKLAACKAQVRSDDAWLVKICMQRNEYDHIVPCCLFKRCDNSPDNLQLQPWPRAHIKDELEAKTCKEFHAGEISQDTAFSRFHRDRPSLTGDSSSRLPVCNQTLYLTRLGYVCSARAPEESYTILSRGISHF